MSQKNSTSKKYYYLTIGIIIFGILLRFIIASYAVDGGDPCYQASAARFIGRNFRFPLYEYIGREIFAHEPLFHIFGAVFYFLFSKIGAGEWGIRMVSPLFGGLLIILTYLTARKLLDEKRALFAVIFVAFLPLSIYHSTTAHIDMVGTFFAFLSFCLLLHHRFYLASVTFGLSLLGRINSIFIVPVLLYLLYTQYHGKKFAARLFIFFAIGLAVASPWFLRNYAVLHNPVWPFLNDFFGGTYTTGHDFKPDKLAHLFNFRDAFVEVHLALFGVPDGKFANLFYIRHPLFFIALIGWLALTVLSVVPLITGLRKKDFKKDRFLIVLLGALPFIFFLYFYQFNYGNTSTRYMLTAVPFLALLWANGIMRIYQKIPQLSIIFLAVFMVSFSASEAIKSGFISHEWKTLDADISWVQSHTARDALFLVPGQCLGYRLDRPSFPTDGTNYRLQPSRDPPLQEIDYIFDIATVGHRPIREDVMQKYLPYFEKVYENPQTKVTIYQQKERP